MGKLRPYEHKQHLNDTDMSSNYSYSTGRKEDNLNQRTTVDLIRGIKGRMSVSIEPDDLADQLLPFILAELDIRDNIKTVRTESTNTSLQDTDEVLLMDCSGGDRACLLMDAADVWDASTNEGQTFYLKKIDDSANEFQVNTTGGQTIDGDPNWVLGPDRVPIQIQSDGTQWHIIG